MLGSQSEAEDAVSSPTSTACAGSTGAVPATDEPTHIAARDSCARSSRSSKEASSESGVKAANTTALENDPT
jgi:hypothetical protein